MQKRTLPLVGLLAVLTLVLVTRHGQAGGAPTYRIGSHVADFAFKSDQGKTVKLSDYRGKTVVLTMFATWCPPCNDEAPHLEREVWQKFKAKNVQVVALSLQEGGPNPFAKIRVFRKKHQVTYPILSDENANVIQKFGFVGIPSIVLIDKNGTYIANPQTVDEVVAKLKTIAK